MATKRYILTAAIFLCLIAFLIIYLIMIPSAERAKILAGEDADISDIVITIRDDSFSPGEVEIYSGQIVLWRNRGNQKHRISGIEFQSSVLNPGESYSHRFIERGTYVYGCEFNPGMRGTIIVK